LQDPEILELYWNCKILR